MDRIDDDIWRWTLRHPEWHPDVPFGREVACFALRSGRRTTLVDPLAPPAGDAREDAFWSALDDLVGDELEILVTIPYHVRSAEPIAERYAGRARVAIGGHEAVARRLRRRDHFRPLAPGDGLAGGGRALAIGSPRRQEMPLLLADAGALAFGDAVVEVDGSLRVWQHVSGERSERWYRERLLPTFRALLDETFERVLPTHGEPVLRDGRDALARALDQPPWHYR